MLLSSASALVSGGLYGDKNMWTQFWDMHSGGGCKLDPYEKIYIEANSQEEAEIIFYNRFGRSPHRVSCTCCGPDYSIDTHELLEQVTGFHRNCVPLEWPQDPARRETEEFRNHYYLEKGEKPPKGYKVDGRRCWKADYLTLEEYTEREDVLIIPKEDISDRERIGSVPREGYVWMD